MDDRWWRGAVIYQIYPRSFADADGDGVGDLAGIRTRLGYVRDLCADAIWFGPWYPSPMVDAGYDVADFRDIAPVFGTLGEAEQLVAEAHSLGLRVIIDVVPNHCSDTHPWFVEAVRAGPGSPQRKRFWFRDGRGLDGCLPPTDLQSIFGGPAWTRVVEPDGRPGQWYLHLFAPQQPDFNWTEPAVRAEFTDVLRFWFDRGIDGIRIDSAAVLVKDAALAGDRSYTDLDGVHDIYREWRRVADEYPGRALIGELWLPDRERFARYLRADELHCAFNFDFLCCRWDAGSLRDVIDETLLAHAPVRAPATWVLSNHDVTRHVTRYGRPDSSFSFATRQRGSFDLELGTRRARAAALLCFALPGAAYVYQGEELGLWEVDDIPAHLIQDPMWHRSGGADPGRDGCRVPLPWSGVEPPFGFSPPYAASTPWLPQPPEWKSYTVEAQSGDPNSMLALYRAAAHIRRAQPALGDGGMCWLDAPPGVLAFRRDPCAPTRAVDSVAPGAPPGARRGRPSSRHGERGTPTSPVPAGAVVCVVNLGEAPVALPPHEEVLLASGPLDGVELPPDTAIWLIAR